MLRIVMDASQVAFTRNAEGKYDAAIDLLLVVFPDSGKSLHQDVHNLQFSIDEARFAQILKNGLVMDMGSDTPPKSARIRIVLHDVASGSVGSLDLPLK